MTASTSAHAMNSSRLGQTSGSSDAAGFASPIRGGPPLASAAAPASAASRRVSCRAWRRRGARRRARHVERLGIARARVRARQDAGVPLAQRREHGLDHGAVGVRLRAAAHVREAVGHVPDALLERRERRRRRLALRLVPARREIREVARAERLAQRLVHGAEAQLEHRALDRRHAAPGELLRRARRTASPPSR